MKEFGFLSIGVALIVAGAIGVISAKGYRTAPGGGVFELTGWPAQIVGALFLICGMILLCHTVNKIRKRKE